METEFLGQTEIETERETENNQRDIVLSGLPRRALRLSLVLLPCVCLVIGLAVYLLTGGGGGEREVERGGGRGLSPKKSGGRIARTPSSVKRV